MLHATKNLVKFVDKVKPNEDAVISMGVKSNGEIEAFFFLHKGNGREIFAKIMLCQTLDLKSTYADKYINLEGTFDGYELRVTFLNERDTAEVSPTADPKAGYPEVVKCSYFWNYMTAEEWKDFMKEFYSINKNAGQDGAFKKYLESADSKNLDFKKLVCGGFTFANTNNEEMWFKISGRTQPIV